MIKCKICGYPKARHSVEALMCPTNTFWTDPEPERDDMVGLCSKLIDEANHLVFLVTTDDELKGMEQLARNVRYGIGQITDAVVAAKDSKK